MIVRRCRATTTTRPRRAVAADDDELNRLVAQLRAHDDAYFNRGAPTIDDAAYDALRRRVDALRRARGLSATESVGAGPRASNATVSHSRPMLSLDRARDLRALERFDQRVRQAAAELGAPFDGYVLEHKYDGLAAAMRFDAHGRLTRVLTRGDGAVGDDVSDAARRYVADSERSVRVDRLPSVLRGVPFEVRGEVLLPRRLAPLLSPRGAATARNVAAGLLMRKLADGSAGAGAGDDDDDGAALAALRFRAFGLQLASGALPLTRYRDVCGVLRDAGLQTCEFGRLVERIDDAAALWNADDAAALRAASEFDLDGLVLKVDSLALQAKLGERNRSPRWAIALKWDGEQAVTRVTGVELTVGRSGSVTPVASIEPVTLGGAELASVSVANLGRAFALGLFPPPSDDAPAVFVRRSGDVIPFVVGRADGVPLRDAAHDDHNAALLAALGGEPPRCPCERAEPLVVRGANQWRCEAPQCERRAAARRLYAFAQLGFEQLAASSLRQLVDAGVVRRDADVLRLPALQARLAEAPPMRGWGERKWRRLAVQQDAAIAQRSLELSRVADAAAAFDVTLLERGAGSVPLWRAIAAIGIETVGVGVARSIAARFPTFARFVALFVEPSGDAERALREVDGVGAVGAVAIAQHMRAMLADADGRDMLYTLGLWAADESGRAAPTSAAAAAALRFCVTGALKLMTRAELADALALRGAALLGDVSGAAHFLVVADAARSSSAKRRKAERLGVHVLSETELAHWLARNEPRSGGANDERHDVQAGAVAARQAV